jgi:hypothetical protein
MSSTVRVDAYSDMKTKRINTSRGQNTEFLISKLLAYSNHWVYRVNKPTDIKLQQL